MNGEGSSDPERALRKYIVKKFRNIHKNIPCFHSPFQFELMAKFILPMDIEGPFVECGCAQGGSTAKLSILAKEKDSKLLVFDTFEGLPEASNEKESILRGSISIGDIPLVAKNYTGSIDAVKSNIQKYGCIEVCEFYKGLFEDTLVNFNETPAVVYIDVDYVSSARDCLKYLWPRLKTNGYFFTHEAGFSEYAKGILDPKWWNDNLGESPPILMGAGSGLSFLTRSLGYMQKL